VIVVNKFTGKQVEFGKNKTVANEEDQDSQFQLCYMIFDVLYVKSLKGDEINLMDHQLKDRKAVLRKIIKTKKHQLECVEGRQTTDINIVFRVFDDSVRDN